jgi:putative oxygen-independent coproporphyrinogen III oxidase
MSLVAPPLALYAHFPWCVRKCPYCDFNSYTLHGALPERAYGEALLCDLAQQAPAARGRRLVSVFLGGGTPSLFSPEALARLLEAMRTTVGFEPDIEITLEANPATIERGRFAEYRAAGINRVSLGAQSFAESALAALGRIHSPADTCRAAEELHAAGLENFNLDLMYALPGQSVADALADIEQALALCPAHLSHYQLTLEPGTLFWARPPVLPDDEAAAEMLASCESRLAAAGFAQYEVSAYARARRHSRHNYNYWTFGDYLGLGAGAHGKLTLAPERRIERTQHLREPRRYQALEPPAPSVREIALQDVPFEFMLNALRLCEGFDRSLFETRTGLSLHAIAGTLAGLCAEGLLSVEGSASAQPLPNGAAPGNAADSLGTGAERWRTTRFGARFLNDVLLRFLPERPATTEACLSTSS